MINIWYVLILLCAFPVGYLLAWLARDELVAGRKWFIALAVVSILCLIPVYFIISNQLPAILTLLFIAIISLIAIWKSHDKKFVNNKRKSL